MTFNVDNYTELVQKYAWYSQSVQNFDKFRLSMQARQQLGLDLDEDSDLANPKSYVGVPDELLHEGLERVLGKVSKKFEAESRPNLDAIVSDAHNALTADGLMGYLVHAPVQPAEGKYDEIVAKHKKLVTYEQIAERAKQTKDIRQVAAFYMKQHEKDQHLLSLIAYHAEHSGNFLVEIFEQGALARAQREFINSFDDKDGKLDSEKLKDYTSYALGSTKDSEKFSNAMLSLATQTYLTKKK